MRRHIITVVLLALLGGCAGQDFARTNACERTINLYAKHVDLGKPERVVELFTEDAIWQFGSAKLEGEDAIRAYFLSLNEDRSRVSRHTQSNIILDWDSRSEARGTVYLTLYRGSKTDQGFTEMKGQPLFVGHYEDQYVYSDNICLISNRKVIPAFIAN